MTSTDLERIEALATIIRESFTKAKAAKAEEALSLLVTFTMVSSCLHTEAIAADRQAAALLLRRAAKGQWDTTSQALTTVAESIARGDHARGAQ
jgi:hypothetical protein